MKPDVYHNMSEEDYFAIPAVNRSSLDEIMKSPFHYYAKHLSPDRVQKKETDSMKAGKAVHVALFEPERFEKEYRVQPTPELYPDALDLADDYKKECERLGVAVSGTKAVLKKRIQDAGSKVQFLDDIEQELRSKFQLISFKDYTAATKLSKNIRESDAASVLLGKGKNETVIVWKDLKTGLLCKARLDRLPDDVELIYELKTTVDARPDQFARAIERYGYHRQASWYMDAVEAAFGVRPKMFVWGVLENEYPFLSRHYYAADRALAIGAMENRQNLDLLAECIKNQKFRGYSEEIEALDLPKYYGKTNQPIIEDFA